MQRSKQFLVHRSTLGGATILHIWNLVHTLIFLFGCGGGRGRIWILINSWEHLYSCTSVTSCNYATKPLAGSGWFVAVRSGPRHGVPGHNWWRLAQPVLTHVASQHTQHELLHFYWGDQALSSRWQYRHRTQHFHAHSSKRTWRLWRNVYYCQLLQDTYCTDGKNKANFLQHCQIGHYMNGLCHTRSNTLMNATTKQSLSDLNSLHLCTCVNHV